MRRILLLITDLKIGGTPTVVRELALRLTAGGGVHVEVACLAPWGPVADQLTRGGINVTAMNARNALSFPIILWRLFRLIRTKKINAVFSFLVHANMIAAIVSLVCSRVRFFQSIQTTQPFPRWHWIMQSIVGHAADRIVVPSNSVADAAREWSRTPNEKIMVIPNAIDINDFAAIAARAGPASAGPALDRRIGFIGRLDPIKRIPDLLEALRLLNPSICLHIFGEGEERAFIEQLIVKLALTDRVTLHGAVTDPRNALAQIDLLVLPSQAEGFGLVLIEAMAAGIPVVATDVAGIGDVVRNGETGLLVPVASPAKLAEAINTLLTDKALRQKLTANARVDVARRFSWDIALSQYHQLLEL